jgi:hypothetical protein
MDLLLAVAVLVASVLGIWGALPKDGKVRPFLRNDTVQTYYAVVLLGGFIGGLLFTVLGLISLFS